MSLYGNNLPQNNIVNLRRSIQYKQRINFDSQDDLFYFTRSSTLRYCKSSNIFQVKAKTMVLSMNCQTTKNKDPAE